MNGGLNYPKNKNEKCKLDGWNPFNHGIKVPRNKTVIRIWNISIVVKSYDTNIIITITQFTEFNLILQTTLLLREVFVNYDIRL